VGVTLTTLPPRLVLPLPLLVVALLVQTAPPATLGGGRKVVAKPALRTGGLGGEGTTAAVPPVLAPGPEEAEPAKAEVPEGVAAVVTAVAVAVAIAAAEAVAGVAAVAVAGA